jgi:uncharacterized protein
MLGELNQDQIDQVLHSEKIGRIGCSVKGKTYIVPTGYAYDGGYIYGQSLPGLKLQMMRTNPQVCFEVEHIINLSNWQSVIVWGIFEELKGASAAQAVRVLGQRIITLIASGLSHHNMRKTEFYDVCVYQERIYVYRIRITEKVGRFEQNEECSI